MWTSDIYNAFPRELHQGCMQANRAELAMTKISEHVHRVWKHTHVAMHSALNVTLASNDRKYASSGDELVGARYKYW
jgi:hypothetical protein